MRRKLTILIIASAFFSLSSCCCTVSKRAHESKAMVDTSSGQQGAQAQAPAALRR